MKKRILGLLMSTVMVASMLVGCGNGGNSTESQTESSETVVSTESTEEVVEATSDVELTFWSMWNSAEPQGQVIQAAADEFKEQTGITVNIEWKGRDINTIIATALEAGESIDIFEDDYSRISKVYKDYCYDLTEMAEAANYADQSYACFNEVSTEWAGFLCSITEQPQVGGVFYNKDIFEECGIAVPTTWADFLAACQTMVDKGYQPLALDSAYAGFTFGYHIDRHLGQEAVADLSLNGGWSESTGAIAAAQDIIDFVNLGYLADGAPDEYPSSQNKIGLTGEVAMVVCANYVAAEVNNNSGTEVNWGMFNYPSVDGGVDPSNAYAGANSLAIASYSEHPQEAFDFLMFLTSKEIDQKMADQASQIPADPRNTAPAIMSGTVETLSATNNPLSWNMGLNENSDLKASIMANVVKLFEGQFSTGEEFAEAMDSLY